MKPRVSDVDKLKSFILLCKPEFKKIEKNSLYILNMDMDSKSIDSIQLGLLSEAINEIMSERNSRCLIVLNDSSINRSLIGTIIYKIKLKLMVMREAIFNKV